MEDQSSDSPTRKEYSSLLVSKEWLVKADNANSTPYLFKFAVSDERNTCALLLTDMKTVWTEVLTRNQIFRRWRQCNPSFPLPNDENSYSRLQSLFQDLHTPGGIADANFDIVKSRDADLAFELDCEEFKWRWDTFLLGPKTSADVISKHLVLPLISLTHISFYSADPVSELEEGDLEKTVDKIGRAARRSVDIHVKQTLSRPRIATTLKRITALLGLAPTLPPIKSYVEASELDGHLSGLRARAFNADDASRPPSVAPAIDNGHAGNEPRSAILESPGSLKPDTEAKGVQPAAAAESATESDDDGDKDVELPPVQGSEPLPSSSKTGTFSGVDGVSEPIGTSQRPPEVQDTDSDSSPPAKKVKSRSKAASDSDSDSDAGTKSRSQGSQGTSAAVRSVTGRGVRQPIKRGGKRF